MVSQLHEQLQVQNIEKVNDIMTGEMPSLDYSNILY